MLAELWARGAFNFLLRTYLDIAVFPKVNREVYNFWAKKVCVRITDPVKKDLMDPLEPSYPLSSKRPPLERDYYECIDIEYVDIVDLKKTHRDIN